MAYSDFTNLDDVESQFGITILSAAPLFRDAKAVPASAPIRYLLEENVSLALNINTEKARSEFIIAPVLVEVRQLLEKKVSLFSGIDFTVEVSCGLNGYCDFLLSYSPDQVFLRAPVACIVEAKNENIKSGYPQCITEMIAARLFNERHRHAVPAILGVVTTGSNWKFLQLPGVAIPAFSDLVERHTILVERVVEWTEQWKEEGLTGTSAGGAGDGPRSRDGAFIFIVAHTNLVFFV